MTNDSIQEMRYVLWVFEATRNGKELVPSADVQRILQGERYEVPLGTIETIRDNLVWAIPRPWMVAQRGEIGNTHARRAYAQTAQRIHDGKPVSKPFALLLKKIYDQRIGISGKKAVSWEARLEQFLREPFSQEKEMTSLVVAIREARDTRLKDDDPALSRGGRVIRTLLTKDVALTKRVRRALGFRKAFGANKQKVMQVYQILGYASQEPKTSESIEEVTNWRRILLARKRKYNRIAASYRRPSRRGVR